MVFPQPRQHHYLFAHKALVEVVFKRPRQMFGALRDGQGQTLLAEAWGDVAAEVDEGEALPTPSFAVSAGRGAVDRWEHVVIAMPEPEEVSEVHMVALLFRPTPRRLFVFKTAGELRYFVLEKGFDDTSGRPRAYVAEYRADGERLRMGDVEAIDEGGFLRAVAEELTPEAAAAFGDAG